MHALEGGRVTQQVRDVIGDLTSIVYKEVLKEPAVQEENGAESVPPPLLI